VPLLCADAVICRSDICRPEDLRDFLEAEDTVFHLAALVGKDANDYAKARAVNVAGMRNLVDLAKAQGARRFVLLSTCCVYSLHSIKDEILDESASHAQLIARVIGSRGNRRSWSLPNISHSCRGACCRSLWCSVGFTRSASQTS
jgi:nucleoside-diphosphate-sugar epimerase